MIKIKTHIILLFFLMLLSNSKLLMGQDIHFTNFNLMPLQQNPSMAGNFDGNYRFSGIYRNQWATVAVPFNTFGFAFDAAFFENKNGSKMGTGLFTYFDQAGDSKFQTLYLSVPLAYNFKIPLNDKAKLNIGVGMSVGIFRKSLRTDLLTFDNQFTGEIFDENINPNENFEQLNFTRPDIGVGGNIGFEIEEKLSAGVGFGVHHLNLIRESFLNDGMNVTLNRRYAMPAFAIIPINNKWELQLDYLFQFQAQKQEHVFGAIAHYYFKNDGPSKKSFGFGSYMRAKDAISAVFRYRVNNFTAGLAYDTNISDFRAATNTYGGIELAVVYTIKNVRTPNIRNKRKCTVF
jgi:type IX secretion system PorP/SprF family membrane protein